MNSASGCGQRHALEPADAVLVRHALRLELRQQLAARALALREQDRHRVLEDRLGERDQLERVARSIAIESLRGLDEVERERREEREVELQGFRDAQSWTPLRVARNLDDAGVTQRAQQLRGAPAQARLRGGRLVRERDQFRHRTPALAAEAVRVGSLQHLHEHAVAHVEHGAEHLGRARDQLVEGVAAPRHEAARRLPLGRVLLRARARGLAAVQDHVLGRLTHDAAAHVEALASGAAGDLAELAHAQQRDLLAVELAELREQHRADRDVDADAEGVGAAHDLEQAALREPLDQQSVLRQQARVVDADAVAQDAAEVLAVGRVEAEARERRGDPRALFARREVRAGEPLRQLAALALREVHDVDRRPVLGDQLRHRLVDRRLAVLEVERHRPLVRVHVRDGAHPCAPAAAPRSAPCCRASRTSAGSASAAARAGESARRRRDRGPRRSGTRPSRRRARRARRPGAAPCSRAPRRCSTRPARTG